MYTVLKQKKASAWKTDRWFKGIYARLLSVFILLFCASLLCGCGGSDASISTIHPHSQPIIPASPFPATMQTFDGDFTIALNITPNRSGSNYFIMQVTDNRAHKTEDSAIITLYTTMQDMPMGTDSVALHNMGGGQFSATSTILSMGGRWAIGITIQTADHVIHKGGLRFTVPQ